MNDLIAIFGYGRFGKLWAETLSQVCPVIVHDPLATVEETETLKAVSLDEALAADTLIYAIPIPAFREVVEQHFLALKKGSASPKLFIDVLSVKVLSHNVFKQHLREGDSALLTHPMFGPDSVAKLGLAGHSIAVDNSLATTDLATHWIQIFEKLGLLVEKMSAEDHDRLAAESQGLTHFIGRVLDEFGMKETAIDTLGAKQLLSIKEQTCNDSWELFSGLQQENPFTVPMRIELGNALEKIYGKLLPKQRDPKCLNVGIQGGKGSFNEEAAVYYLKRQKIEHYKLHYLYTTENVLRKLHEGEVDCGQFAIHNSAGGMVEESMLAMAERRFSIREQFSILIAHALMTKKGVSPADIDTIMTHPQVLKQCRKTLSEKYPRLKQTSGGGEMIDSANAGRALSEGELTANHAVMGSKIIAEIYDLDIIEEDLQDLSENFTSFLWVERPLGDT